MTEPMTNPSSSRPHLSSSISVSSPVTKTSTPPCTPIRLCPTLEPERPTKTDTDVVCQSGAERNEASFQRPIVTPGPTPPPARNLFAVQRRLKPVNPWFHPIKKKKKKKTKTKAGTNETERKDDGDTKTIKGKDENTRTESVKKTNHIRFSDPKVVKDEDYKVTNFVAKVDSFHDWLTTRKRTWRKSWAVHEVDIDVTDQKVTKRLKPTQEQRQRRRCGPLNPWFVYGNNGPPAVEAATPAAAAIVANKEAVHVVFDHYPSTFDGDDENRANQYLVNINSLPSWLAQRKAMWRQSWNVHAVEGEPNDRPARPVCIRRPQPLNPWFSTTDHIRTDLSNASGAGAAATAAVTTRLTTQNGIPFDTGVSDVNYDNQVGAGQQSHSLSFLAEDHKAEGYIGKIGSIHEWLSQRKAVWRRSWKPYAVVDDSVDQDILPLQHQRPLQPNPWFSNASTIAVGEDESAGATTTTARTVDTNATLLTLTSTVHFDETVCLPWDEEHTADRYLVNIGSVNDWLETRKATWRRSWNPYVVEDDGEKNEEPIEPKEERTVAHDFWSPQGLTLDQWVLRRTREWKKGYSWNQRKRKRIQEQVTETIPYPNAVLQQEEGRYNETEATELWQNWIRVRKNQWRLQRRKRQRLRDRQAQQLQQQQQQPQEHHQVTTEGRFESPLVFDETIKESKNEAKTDLPLTDSLMKLKKPSVTSNVMQHIDTLLDDEEAIQKRKAETKRAPFDISFLFDGRLGVPDDVIAHCVGFLHPSEHSTLLSISFTTATAMKERIVMWRQLCPTHWILPRRPRKPWHEMYLSRMRKENETARKRSDDLLTKVAALLFKSDQLVKVERLVKAAEKAFGFEIDYTSGVVCERNSMLNMAVIHGRSKIVRWLVEHKKADIECIDRGDFTPLMNAAWKGDKSLVRYLLAKGSDRTKRGRCHSSGGLAPPTFEGHTAEEWARKRGHSDVADLIKLGL